MIYCMACDAQQLSLVGAPCQCGSNSWRGWAQTPVLPKRPEEMTNAELQAEIGCSKPSITASTATPWAGSV